MFKFRFFICLVFYGITYPLCAQYPQISYPQYPYPTSPPPQRQLYAPNNVTPQRVFLTAQTDGGQPNNNQPIQFEPVQHDSRIQFVPNQPFQQNRHYIVAKNPPVPAPQPNIPAPPLRQIPPPQNGQHIPQLTPDVPAEGTVSSTTASATAASTTSETQMNASLPDGALVSMLSALLDADVRITADTKTNTIIVVAEPQIQEHYATLIKFLDRRSPQVLIEAKIVTLDTSNDFMLGVEISGGDRKGDKRLFGFSSFGLSTPDPVSGALALLPGLGFNGTLVDPDTADVIVRALSSNSRAKVIASPRLLINDNEEGRLQSVQSIPYTSVNSSQVVQSTSLGGNQDAGTTIVVTPHIGDSEQLQLEFAVEFSNFGASATNANLPPPRHIDQVSSVVTIPDGYTVIVGGLNRSDIESGRTGLPFLDKIPLLKYLASTENDNKKNTSLFVFLKPIILRDDKFKDLKYLSDQDARSAQIRATLPQSRPLVME